LLAGHITPHIVVIGHWSLAIATRLLGWLVNTLVRLVIAVGLVIGWLAVIAVSWPHRLLPLVIGCHVIGWLVGHGHWLLVIGHWLEWSLPQGHWPQGWLAGWHRLALPIRVAGVTSRWLAINTVTSSVTSVTQ